MAKQKDYILRPRYLNRIRPFIDKDLIKILTGMRRSGKSTCLKMIMDLLGDRVAPENMLYINFEAASYRHILKAENFYQYLKNKLKDTEGKLYFFFDEVQRLENWEQIVNGLRVKYNCDIYVTSSKSNLLSSNLATLLAGRYVQFENLPFSFQEFCHCFQDFAFDKNDLFEQFIMLGGMPFLHHFALNKSASMMGLEDMLNTIIVKDILSYHAIRDIDLFQRILSFAAENIGQTFSANSIHRYLKSENREVSVDTILNYLEYCQEAFILKKIPRYDAVGKRLLRVDEKYYLNDHGLREALGFSNTKDIERVLENIVFTELISRDYLLYVGRVGDKEIDFIAQKDGDIAYYQVAYLLASEETREREFGVYEKINDNYPKYVLSMDELDFSRNGIQHKNIIDFLLEDEA